VYALCMLRMCPVPLRYRARLKDMIGGGRRWSAGFYDIDKRLKEAMVRLAPEERKSNAGLKLFDAVMMFKLLVLQTADEKVKYQVGDRLSFMRFLGLGLQDVVPDATTVWLFREALTKADLVKALFGIDRFNGHLNAKDCRSERSIPSLKNQRRKAPKPRVVPHSIAAKCARKPQTCIRLGECILRWRARLLRNKCCAAGDRERAVGCGNCYGVRLGRTRCGRAVRRFASTPAARLPG